MKYTRGPAGHWLPAVQKALRLVDNLFQRRALLLNENAVNFRPVIGQGTSPYCLSASICESFQTLPPSFGRS